MTITDPQTRTGFQLVAADLYRDIHKGIRAELFGLTNEAGSLDPAARPSRAALATRVSSAVELLETHAAHEDRVIGPALEIHLPDLAEKIERDHARIEGRLVDLRAMAEEAVDAPRTAERGVMHRIYLELSSFTSDYLEHQDVEERVVMPALEQAVGVESVLAMHHDIVSNIPPNEMAQSLAVMLPAMNIDDRADVLGGMRAGAPAEVFAGIWGLAGSVLTAPDHTALAARLGLA